MDADTEYFKLRAEEERQAARRSAHFCARDRHIELVERYDDRVDALSPKMIRVDA